MTVTTLPSPEKFNLQSLNSKEAFKRAIGIFMNTLLLDRDSSTHKFNYVCREILQLLELDKMSAIASASFEERAMGLMSKLESVAEQEEDLLEAENFIDYYMRLMDMKAASKNIILGDAFIPGNFEDIVHKSNNRRLDL